MLKVRLAGLRETNVYEPVEEEAYKRQLVAYEGLPSPRPVFDVQPPKGRLILSASLYSVSAKSDPVGGGVSAQAFWLECPLELLPDGARIGDEFEIQFVKVRK